MSLECFRIQKELGSGAHGTVQLARVASPTFDLRPGQLVALKFLRRELIENDAFVRRFRREAEIGMSIRHPNVVRIHGLLEDTMLGLPYLALVMEYVSGSTLRELLDTQGPPLEALVLRVGSDTARGLAAMHAERIVHRDLKPENLYLADDGSAKIMDLGYADQITSGRSSLAGTLAYAAPELLRGQAATEKSDLFALALVLYELAAGRLPWSETTDVDRAIDVRLHAAIPSLSTYRPRTSPFLDELLAEMMRHEPSARPFDAPTLADALRDGPRSSWWQLRQRVEPVLRSRDRIRATRRPAPTPLFGRDAELARLEDALGQASLGVPQAVLVTGPEAVGKRRLVDEFALRCVRQAEDRERDHDAISYLAGECSIPGVGRPVSPFGWFLMKAFDVEPDEEDIADRDRLDHAVTRLAFRLQYSGGLDADRAEAVAQALFDVPGAERMPLEATAEALCSLANARCPLVLRVHRADRLTKRGRRLVRHLMQSGANILIVLCTHTGHALGDLGVEIDEIELEPLDGPAAREFVFALFDDSEDAETRSQNAAWILSQVESLPGLLLDALDYAHSRGDVQGRPGSYHDMVPQASFPIAGRLESYVDALFESEDESARELLTAAAVLGVRFRIDDLAALLDVEELALLERLSAFRDRWFLGADTQLRFRRRSQRRFALERSSPEQRARYQLAAVERFEARGARPLKRAIHWARAGVPERALPLLLDAAHRALRRRELTTCELLLGRAHRQLQAAHPIPEISRARLRYMHMQARLAYALGRPSKARKRVQRALPLARITGDTETARRLRVLDSRAARAQGLRSDALQIIDEVLPELDEDSQTGLEARLDRAALLDDNANLRAAWRVAVEVERQARTDESVDDGLVARSSIVLATIEAKRLRIDRAEELFTAAETLLRQRGETRGRIELHLRRGSLALDLGRKRQVDAELESLDDLIDSRTLRGYRARRFFLAASHCLATDRIDEALPLLARAERDAVSSGDAFGGVAVQVARFEIALARGEADHDAATELLRVTSRAGDPRLWMSSCTHVAGFHRRRGDLDHATRQLDAAFRELELRSVEPTFQLGMMLERADLQSARGLTREADRTLELARRRLDLLTRRLRFRDRTGFRRANPSRRALTESRSAT